MRVVSWDGAEVSTASSMAVARPMSGAELRDTYIAMLPEVTLGLARFRRSSVVLGPLELLRFGAPQMTSNSVEWPIVGGLLARRAGGSWRLNAAGGRAEAVVSGYVPSLPRAIYDLTQLQVHLFFARLYLLRLRGRDGSLGPPASQRQRRRAASIDVAFCVTLAALTGRRRPARTLAIAIAYHVICWSTTGRTLGGVVTRQRVVAIDGSRLTPPQSLLRLALLPLSWVVRRPLHDEIAGTDVIAG